MSRRVDYEAAWEELQEFVLTREGWGTQRLVTEMASLRVKHKIPADSSTSATGGMPTGSRVGDATTDRSEEDHDGRSTSAAGLRAA